MAAMLDNGFYQIALVILNGYEMYPKGNDALFRAFIDMILEKNDGTEIVNFMQAVVRSV